jgi:hypothetical protein
VSNCPQAFLGLFAALLHSATRFGRWQYRYSRPLLLAVLPFFMRFYNLGWLPAQRAALPFRSIVAASRNDPLARYARVAELAEAWKGQLIDLGEVGHLNPASGYGDWPLADSLLECLAAAAYA